MNNNDEVILTLLHQKGPMGPYELTAMWMKATGTDTVNKTSFEARLHSLVTSGLVESGVLEPSNLYKLVISGKGIKALTQE